MKRRRSVYERNVPGFARKKRKLMWRRTAFPAAAYGGGAMTRRPRRFLNQRIGGFLGIEKKYLDSFKTSTAVGQAWAGGEYDPAANCLCYPQKGTGPTNRDGDHIVMKSIHIRGDIRMPTEGDTADITGPIQYCIMLVLDKQTNGAQLSAEDVMTDTEPQEHSFRNLQYGKRFTILKDWRGVIYPTAAFTDGANTGSQAGNARNFGCNLNVNIPVDFKGDAGNVADIVDNSLHIIACTNALGLEMKYASRVRFVG